MPIIVDTTASVAISAAPSMPAAINIEIRITPVPVMPPSMKPNAPPATTSPPALSRICARCSKRRSGMLASRNKPEQQRHPARIELRVAPDTDQASGQARTPACRAHAATGCRGDASMRLALSTIIATAITGNEVGHADHRRQHDRQDQAGAAAREAAEHRGREGDDAHADPLQQTAARRGAMPGTRRPRGRHDAARRIRLRIATSCERKPRPVHTDA